MTVFAVMLKACRQGQKFQVPWKHRLAFYKVPSRPLQFKDQRIPPTLRKALCPPSDMLTSNRRSMIKKVRKAECPGTRTNNGMCDTKIRKEINKSWIQYISRAKVKAICQSPDKQIAGTSRCIFGPGLQRFPEIFLSKMKETDYFTLKYKQPVKL